MPEVSQEQVLKALAQIIDPDFGKDIVSLGFVKDIAIDDGRVAFTIELTTPACPVKEEFRQQAMAAVGAVAGVIDVAVNITSRVQSHQQQGIKPIPGVKNIIAIASGKGGVGKSTTAVNLAVALTRTGAKAGLLDADIYGPSIPRMMGLAGRQPQVVGEKMLPLVNYGVSTISIGYLIREEDAMIWRGPMVAGALSQLLSDVSWGELDYLIVDLPPGTGDAQLTLVQQAPVTAAIIVTTPQDIALQDAKRGIGMFEKVKVPVLGLVENMSVFICPHCGESSHIFDTGGADRLSGEHNTEVLAHLPLDIHIREDSDSGTPIVAARPDSKQAVAYCALAGEIARRVSTLPVQKPIDIPVQVQPG